MQLIGIFHLETAIVKWVFVTFQSQKYLLKLAVLVTNLKFDLAIRLR